MKRFWLVLLSLGLIAAFSTSAMAVDIKISGEFYAAGMYLNSVSLVKSAVPIIAYHDSQSTAFYFQRLRVRTEFIVSPGLSLITRADIMERAWGAPRSTPGTSHLTGYLENDSAGTDAENENIAFDVLFLRYLTPVGLWEVGLTQGRCWGTAFGDNLTPTGTLSWFGQTPDGKLTFGVQMTKERDNSANAKTPSTQSDKDLDGYVAFAFYNWKNAEAGLVFKYKRDATGKNDTNLSYMSDVYILLPYAKVKVGPVAIEAEVNYAWGTSINPDVSDIYSVGFQEYKIDSWIAYINAVADFGKFYGGGTFAFLGGNDPNTTRIQGALNGGTNWNPTLILWNYDRYNWAGAGTNGNYGYTNYNTANHISGTWTPANADGPMTNAYFVQGKVGVKPVAKLDVSATVSYASAVVKPTNEWVHNDYGWEVDATATYKISNNLSYMLGVGYLFTDNYFKGADDTTDLRNNYLVINKLTLTF